MGRDQVLQRDIMELILHSGRESSSTIETKLENGVSVLTGKKYQSRDRQTIRDALADGSEPRKFELVLEKESAQGKHEKFYSCTTYGVKWFLDREKPSVQYFWDVLFEIGSSELQFYFKTKRKGNSTKKIDGQSVDIEKERLPKLCINEIISHYERFVYGVSREYFCGNATLDYLYFIGNIYAEQPDLFLIIAKILDKLLDNKVNSTKHGIQNVIKSVTKDVRFFDDRFIDLYEFLNERNEDKFEIALNGILLLFLYYRDHLHSNYFNRLQNKIVFAEYLGDDEIKDKIDSITTIYEDYFPNVFPMWKFMRRILGNAIYKSEMSQAPYPADLILLTCLVDQYRNGQKEAENKMYEKDSHLPIVNLLHMEKVFHNKFYYEYECAKGSFSDWVVKNKIPSRVIFQHEFEPTEYMSNLISYPAVNLIKILDEIPPDKKHLEKITEYLTPIQQFFELGYLLLSSKGREFQKESSRYNLLLKRLEDRISFSFYIILRSKIGEDTWNSILSSNPDVRKWFAGWMGIISNFEKNNLEFIEKIQKEAV